MSLKIRLSRGGAKKHPFYRIVVADSRSPRDGRFIERVGTYDPMIAKDDPRRVVIKEDRIKYWLGVGGKPTDRVARMLSDAGLMEKPVVHEQTKKNQPKAKAVERAKEAEDAAKAAAEAAAEAEAAAKAEEASKSEADEAPAEAAEETKADEVPAEA